MTSSDINQLFNDDFYEFLMIYDWWNWQIAKQADLDMRIDLSEKSWLFSIVLRQVAF